MANNTTLNAMSGGDIIQTEDFGASGKMERVKVALGNSGVDGGDVSATNPLPVTGTFYQTTQPVSGTVTANAGTNLNTSALALETGGNLASLVSNEGTTSDVAVTGDVTGSLSAKLRGLSKIFNSVWNSTSNFLKIGMYFSDGTAVNQSGGNIMVNVGNLGTGTLGNSDGNAAGTYSALVFTYPQVFNGTTWDRLKGDATNGAYVQIKNTPTVQDVPQTTGGLTPYKLISAATTNATSVKASAGQVYTIAAFNTTAAVAYLKIYDKASAPTVGTDTPKHTYVLPANSTNGAGFVLNIDKGINFALGIAFAITGAITDADTTAVALNQVVINLDYK